VRRVTSRLAGHVEPLNHGSYLIAHGRNLDIITQAQTIENFQPLREDLGRLSRAFYAVELLDRATEERAENFALYRLLLDALRRLAARDDLDLVLRFFEMALLDELGYRPQVDGCVLCGRALAAEGNAWSPAVGGALCSDCRPADVAVRPLSSSALTALRVLQASVFSQSARQQIGAELGEELERHLREAIHHALDRDVRSASFLDIVRRRLRNASPARGAGSR
jgi:DNA repair protein RecO (recombination protein O)